MHSRSRHTSSTLRPTTTLFLIDPRTKQACVTVAHYQQHLQNHIQDAAVLLLFFQHKSLRLSVFGLITIQYHSPHSVLTSAPLSSCQPLPAAGYLAACHLAAPCQSLAAGSSSLLVLPSTPSRRCRCQPVEFSANTSTVASTDQSLS